MHHGDGVEAVFWDDPRVLTISLHESRGRSSRAPGVPTRSAGRRRGFAVNVALPAGTGDDGWLRALHSVVPQLLEAFSPQVLVTQHGCDSHFLDPLAHLALSVDGQRMAAERCTPGLTGSPTADGWRREAAATRSSTSCPAPGPC